MRIAIASCFAVTSLIAQEFSLRSIAFRDHSGSAQVLPGAQLTQSEYSGDFTASLRVTAAAQWRGLVDSVWCYTQGGQPIAFQELSGQTFFRGPTVPARAGSDVSFTMPFGYRDSQNTFYPPLNSGNYELRLYVGTSLAYSSSAPPQGATGMFSQAFDVASAPAYLVVPEHRHAPVDRTIPIQIVRGTAPLNESVVVDITSSGNVSFATLTATIPANDTQCIAYATFVEPGAYWIKAVSVDGSFTLNAPHGHADTLPNFPYQPQPGQTPPFDVGSTSMTGWYCSKLGGPIGNGGVFPNPLTICAECWFTLSGLPAPGQCGGTITGQSFVHHGRCAPYFTVNGRGCSLTPANTTSPKYVLTAGATQFDCGINVGYIVGLGFSKMCCTWNDSGAPPVPVQYLKCSDEWNK